LQAILQAGKQAFGRTCFHSWKHHQRELVSGGVPLFRGEAVSRLELVMGAHAKVTVPPNPSGSFIRCQRKPSYPIRIDAFVLMRGPFLVFGEDFCS